MSEFTIRPATEADAATIKRIVQSNPLDPNAIDWHYFLVLEVVEGSAPVIASIGMVHPVDGITEIDSVATVESYRKRGFARAVVQAIVDRTPHPIYLLSETKLLAFYEQFGFRVIAPADAPDTMRAQAEYVNRWFGDYATYHIMGTSAG